MYCAKCGRLAHGDRPCGEIIQRQPGAVGNPVMTGPTMVVVAPPQTRLEASGWFTRTFLTCAGVMAAIMLVVAGILFATRMMLHEEAAVLRDKVEKAEAALSALTIQAKKMAAKRLEKHGIIAISDDAYAGEYEGDIVLVGTGRARSGGLQKFFVRYHVATFGKEQRWSLRSLIIEGKEHYSPRNAGEGL